MVRRAERSAARTLPRSGDGPEGETRQGRIIPPSPPYSKQRGPGIIGAPLFLYMMQKRDSNRKSGHQGSTGAVKRGPNGASLRHRSGGWGAIAPTVRFGEEQHPGELSRGPRFRSPVYPILDGVLHSAPLYERGLHGSCILSMVTRIGPLATINCEPRQARKGATAAVDLGAGVWLVRVATF
jgi:hypothetical protein